MRESSPAIPSSFEDVLLTTTSMVSTILTLHFLLCKKRHHKEAENRLQKAYDLVMCFSCFVSRSNTPSTTTIYCKTYDVWRVKKLKYVGNWKWYLLRYICIFAHFFNFEKKRLTTNILCMGNSWETYWHRPGTFFDSVKFCLKDKKWHY